MDTDLDTALQNPYSGKAKSANTVEPKPQFSIDLIGLGFNVRYVLNVFTSYMEGVK